MTRSAGYHGKIPTQGDFIQRGLPLAFTRAWDRWLMEGIAALKARRGDGWLDGYRSAPLWRFAAPGGAFGEAAMVGVLIASLDRVGRTFPLTIASEAPQGLSPFAALLAEAAMLDRMAETALNAVAGGVKKDALDAAVDAIRSEAAEPPQVEETAEALTVKGVNPEGAIAARWLERRYGADAALFISDAAAHGMMGEPRQLIAARGAPRPALVAQLFAGGGRPAPRSLPAEDDLDLLAPIDPGVVAPVVAMTAAASVSPASDDDIDALIGGEPLAPHDDAPPPPAKIHAALPPELDPDFDPDAQPEADSPPPAAATGPGMGPATEEELDALIGWDPLSDEKPAAPPPPPRPERARDAEGEEEDDPIAAILAGGGTET